MLLVTTWTKKTLVKNKIMMLLKCQRLQLKEKMSVKGLLALVYWVTHVQQILALEDQGSE